jgi:hypothetical protein
LPTGRAQNTDEKLVEVPCNERHTDVTLLESKKFILRQEIFQPGQSSVGQLPFKDAYAIRVQALKVILSIALDKHAYVLAGLKPFQSQEVRNRTSPNSLLAICPRGRQERKAESD